ncbi:MAG: energy transducer TonB [Gluconacetobacter diazotrophicus]|nr:energy transducer TonB [Gluconacetobacter diazotrophicus]
MRAVLVPLLLLTACAADPDALPYGPVKVVETPTDYHTPLRHRGVAAYPPDLLQQRIEGQVLLDCAITPDGVPEDCVVKRSTDHRFDAAALEYQSSIRYRPLIENGAVLYRKHEQCTVNYRLSGDW